MYITSTPLILFLIFKRHNYYKIHRQTNYLVMTFESLGYLIGITIVFVCGSSSVYSRFAARTAVDKAVQIFAVLGLNVGRYFQTAVLDDSACGNKKSINVTITNCYNNSTKQFIPPLVSEVPNQNIILLSINNEVHRLFFNFICSPE